ncbi:MULTISPECIES: ligase-associated DNA damage response DEXH box helicase [unclassified Cyanobium]|uniref:ligase-associated DNA damage response DEXH box helicase n=1 Tax=unclassified Cyanobium TaxID=2627006 RepID=UPI0020CC5701|nr:MULTISPECIES: ligase-associated DNA damage response DEXH box helicase [unclassified Cyanobium]MCP9777536.1 ligase-associated DNA damage response DEXH box helicase [Cyanobium sp. Tous-M-B4]MCP9875446.1 ligase-associated DNA damage response DEXH box helicase [Cyanobium sp. A2C-AMD]
MSRKPQSQTKSCDLLAPIEAWFELQGWTPLPFQRQCWQAYLAGESGLIQVPTGSGKTYAAVMGPIAELLAEPSPGLRLLYLTPLRALSRDLALAIQQPIEAMGWPLRVGIRNGDTSGYERGKQLRSPPEILITTPESLSLLLANPKAPALFAGLRAVVLDEWHELMGSKRGSQTELCLSWLRSQQPSLRTWAISATIGNLEEAARSALGAASEPRLITAPIARATEIRSLLPESIDGFPWAGHLGLRRYEDLVAALEPGVSTLLFTNTRNQAERWHQCLRYACPEMEHALALHHSAIDRAEREAIEAGVKAGALRWVVCTSSLDLGVDFQPVERVVQIGSAKNVARLLQRAGRSAHLPGGTSQVLFMPTHALELLELSALRRGLAAGLVEERRQPNAPIDVLLQHLTSLACGPGFQAESELAVVRSAWSYRQLNDSDWQWCLRFLEHGGDCLGAYPRYRKLEREGDLYLVKEKAIARMHRLHIGTITADRAVTVRFVRGAVLGHVEEAFIGRLKAGDVFFFAGRQLEFVRLREMTAQVKASSKKSSTVPAWSGGQMALSDLLSQHLRAEVDRCARALAGEAKLDSPELVALEPLLQRQVQLSRLPRQHELLVEVCNSREGSHLYAYPFEGRFVHEGLGFLWAWRLARHRASTITVSVNDYGFELLAPKNYPFEELFELHAEELLDDNDLKVDLEQAINLSELCRRRFRAIAQISGLVLNGYPGQSKSGGQLQISAALLYDVFSRHEPANRLLTQARSEVLTEQLDLPRITLALQRLQRCSLQLERTARPGPLAFPLLAERLNNRMSNESLLQRLERLRQEAESAEEGGLNL